jgi:hypothetical protein
MYTYRARGACRRCLGILSKVQRGAQQRQNANFVMMAVVERGFI